MSDAATQLLATFESLPASEQHSLLMELLRRSSASPDAMVGDDQLVLLADERFQALDAEEAHGGDAHSK
jgi:hypothetical protein